MVDPVVPAWGCPWHGLIDDGRLTLPNGDTMVYPQPASGLQQSGNTLLQQMPWAVDPVPVSEAQAAYDSEHGRQWKPWAILAGSDRQLHGKNIGGWIYAAPTGTPWLVDGPALFNSLSNPALLESDFHFTRFGVLGGKPERFTTSVSVATGQSSPALTLAGTVYLELMDITPDGSKAILMLHNRNVGQVIGTYMPLGLIPLGFLLMELSGTPGDDLEVNISVLRTRAQTLGEGADTGALSPPAYNAYLTLDVNVTVQIVGGYPSCSGYRQETATQKPLGVTMGDPPAGTPPDNYKLVYFGELSRTSSITGRIVAMWFDSSGAAKPVTLDMKTVETASYPDFDFTYSGQNIIRWPHTGETNGDACVLGQGFNFETSLTFHLSRTIQTRVNSSVLLKYDGREIEAKASSIGSSEYSLISAFTDRLAHITRNSAIESPAGGNTQSSSFNPTVDDWWRAQRNPGLYSSTPIGITPMNRYQLQNVQRFTGFTLSWFLGIARYSNNLYGLFAAWEDDTDANATGRYLGTLSPGATTSSETPLYSNDQLITRLKGSYHPVTHAVDRNKDHATCWI